MSPRANASAPPKSHGGEKGLRDFDGCGDERASNHDSSDGPTLGPPNSDAKRGVEDSTASFSEKGKASKRVHERRRNC